MTMRSDTEPARFRMHPVLASVIVLLCLAGGAILGWRWLASADRGIEAIPLASAGEENDGQRRPRDSGPVLRREPWMRVRIAGVELRARTIEAGKLDIRMHALGGGDWLNQEQQRFLHAAEAILENPELSAKLQLTGQQLASLRNLRLDTTLALTEAQRLRLQELCLQWRQAADPAKPAAEQALLEAIKEIGPAHVDACRQQLLASADQAKTILTPQQWEQYWKLRPERPQRGPAATRPATTPPK